MERIRNFISPRARRKKLDLGGDGVPGLTPTPKTFGVALHDLMLREPPDALVPKVVCKICHYIYKFGLDFVGLFRVSGSVRVVEKMRMQFDLTGDVNFEDENDIAATAGLLKVFLRDLPETLIPESVTSKFFTVVKDPKLKKSEKLDRVKSLLELLPDENVQLLKYICSLLVVVADNEEENKMSAFTLAILFGPNVFTYQVSSGLEGMKDMDTSKDVMQLFISHYNFLFAEEGDPSPKDFWEKCDKKKTPPARPPPPKIFSSPSPVPSVESITSCSLSPSHSDNRPVPSPRKIKNMVDSTSSNPSMTSISTVADSGEDEDLMLPINSTSSVSQYEHQHLFSPKDEEHEHSRAYSPFGFESDSHSIIDSPMVTARTSEFVEKTIVETISEHIFGVFSNAGCLSSNSTPRLSFEEKDIDQRMNGETPVVKPRTSLANRNRSVAPSSSLEDNETQSISNHIPFDDLPASQLLQGVRKPVGPPRRGPSVKRRSWDGSPSPSPQPYDINGNDCFSSSSINPFFQKVPISSVNDHDHINGDSVNGDYGIDMVDGQQDYMQSSNNDGEEEERSDDGELVLREMEDDRDNNNTTHSVVAEKRVKARRSYADVVNGWDTPAPNENQISPPSSPTHAGNELKHENTSPPATTALTLMIPPLDFSTLHQHVDGVDARPTSNDQVSSHSWINKADLLSSGGDHNAPVVSPRSGKMKKRNGPRFICLSSNTDIPPSPPIYQDLYKKHSDDECSLRLRQLTKKIQGLKKKIKSFEENFEKVHGFRPSQGERAAHPEIKKFMMELSKARKDLKQLKENTEKTNRSRHNSGASSSGMEMSPPVIQPVAVTLEVIMHGLKEKRQEVGRPQELALMSREEIQQEKLDVQKALLKFEGIHGRPSTKEEKDLMRPLYDRYRQIKRTLAKPVSPRNSLELQPVPEDVVMEIPRTFNRAPIHVHVPTAFVDEENNETDAVDLGVTNDCFGIVTRDFSRLGVVKDHMVLHDIDLPPNMEESQEDRMGEEEEEEDGRSQDGERGRADAHLHELSLQALHVEIETSRKEKKKLRKVLRQFEEDFHFQHGRKVQKEDRHPLQSEYSNYKKVKARLRLLEALVLKHHEAVC